MFSHMADQAAGGQQPILYGVPRSAAPRIGGGRSGTPLRSVLPAEGLGRGDGRPRPSAPRIGDGYADAWHPLAVLCVSAREDASVGFSLWGCSDRPHRHASLGRTARGALESRRPQRSRDPTQECVWFSANLRLTADGKLEPLPPRAGESSVRLSRENVSRRGACGST